MGRLTAAGDGAVSVSVQGLGLSGNAQDEKAWNDVPISVQNEIDSFIVTWVQDTGGVYLPKISDLLALYNQKALSQESVAQYLFGKMSSDQQQAQPWAAVGVDRDTYHTYTQQFSTMFETLTGQQMGVDQIQKALQQGYTASTYRDFLMADKNTLETYGWLKYGYNYQQFQTYKEGLNQSFGAGRSGGLSDQQALLQLQYLHSASSGPTAVAKPPSRQGQTPTEQTQSEVR